jgi:hypothetical protein
VGTEKKEEIPKCQTVSTSCNLIDKEETCKTEGAAISIDSNDIIECFWLEDNSNANTENGEIYGGRCISKVCFYYNYVLNIIINN